MSAIHSTQHETHYENCTAFAIVWLSMRACLVGNSRDNENCCYDISVFIVSTRCTSSVIIHESNGKKVITNQVLSENQNHNLKLKLHLNMILKNKSESSRRTLTPEDLSWIWDLRWICSRKLSKKLYLGRLFLAHQHPVSHDADLLTGPQTPSITLSRNHCNAFTVIHQVNT